MFYKVSEMKKLLKKYHDYTSEELNDMNENRIKAIFLQRRTKMIEAIYQTNPVVHRKSELKQLEYEELLGLYSGLFPKPVAEKTEIHLTMEDVKDIYAEELACLTEEEFERFLKENNIKIIPNERVYTEAELEAMYPGSISESSNESLLYFLSTNNIQLIKDGMTAERLKKFTETDVVDEPGCLDDDDDSPQLKYKL